jgi:hypothetical protein
MIIQIDSKEGVIYKISGNYLCDIECFEIEIIKNELPCDTTYRIELADGDYLNMSKGEFKTLYKILDNPQVQKWIYSEED